jgi:hypothetical protein
MQQRTICTLAAFLLLAACSGMGGNNSSVPQMSAPMPTSGAMNMPGMHPSFGGSNNSGAQTGTTPGWLNGKTVTFFYHTNNFFCRVPVEDGQPVGSTSLCELGSDSTINPRPADHSIPTLYVMTPLGFRPDASTLHCPTVGNCINHPSTIDLSRVFGPGTANAPLPAHSHIIVTRSGNWWGLTVIGVKDLATWNQIVAGKSLNTVRALQAADPTHVHIGPDTLTNTYLYFQVQ